MLICPKLCFRVFQLKFCTHFSFLHVPTISFFCLTLKHSGRYIYGTTQFIIISIHTNLLQGNMFRHAILRPLLVHHAVYHLYCIKHIKILRKYTVTIQSPPASWGPRNVADTATGTLPLRTPSAWNATWTDRLKKDLLFSYDKYARPAQHTNTTVVSLHVTFRHIDLVGLLTSLLFVSAALTNTNVLLKQINISLHSFKSHL